MVVWAKQNCYASVWNHFKDTNVSIWNHLFVQNVLLNLRAWKQQLIIAELITRMVPGTNFQISSFWLMEHSPTKMRICQVHNVTIVHIIGIMVNLRNGGKPVILQTKGD